MVSVWNGTQHFSFSRSAQVFVALLLFHPEEIHTIFLFLDFCMSLYVTLGKRHYPVSPQVPLTPFPGKLDSTFTSSISSCCCLSDLACSIPSAPVTHLHTEPRSAYSFFPKLLTTSGLNIHHFHRPVSSLPPQAQFQSTLVHAVFQTHLFIQQLLNTNSLPSPVASPRVTAAKAPACSHLTCFLSRASSYIMHLFCHIEVFPSAMMLGMTFVWFWTRRTIRCVCVWSLLVPCAFAGTESVLISMKSGVIHYQ